MRAQRSNAKSAPRSAKKNERLKLGQPERGMALIMASSPRDQKLRSWEIAQALEIKPALDVERLARAFQHIVHLHPRLRAVYLVADGEVSGRLLPAEDFQLQMWDASALPEAEFLAQLQARADQPWDLARGPLIEITAIARPRKRMVLLLRVNHLLIDGWSIEVLLRDMMMYYLGLGGEQSRAPGFEAFVEWEEKFLASPAGRDQRLFWRKKLAGMGPRLKLPYDRPPTSPFIATAGDVHFALDKAMTAQMHALARRSGASLFAVLLTAFQTLLSGLSGRNDLVVTTTTNRRTKAEFANVVGFMGNLIAVRSAVADDVAFGRQVALANRAIGEALDHQELHILLVVDELADGKRDQYRNADLGDTCFDQVALCMLTPNLGDVPDAGLRLKYRLGETTKVGPYGLRLLPLERSHTTRDLTLYFNEFDGEVACFFAYSADVFDRATIEGMVARLRTILTQGCARPETSLRQLKPTA